MDDNEKTVYYCLYNMVLITDFIELVELVNGQIHCLGTQRALKIKKKSNIELHIIIQQHYSHCDNILLMIQILS